MSNLIKLKKYSKIMYFQDLDKIKHLKNFKLILIIKNHMFCQLYLTQDLRDHFF